MKKIRNLTRYLIINFGPVLAFYFINHFYGLRPAVIGGVLVAIIEIIRFKVCREKMSKFFIFSSSIALIFGLLDLTVKVPFFFRYEAGLINFSFALFFVASLFQKKQFCKNLQSNKDVLILPNLKIKHFSFES